MSPSSAYYPIMHWQALLSHDGTEESIDKVVQWRYAIDPVEIMEIHG